MYFSSNIYHLKLEDNHPQMTLARCSSKENKVWRMYSKKNFVKGHTYNVEKGNFIRIEGKKCKKCLKLLTHDSK